MDANTVKELSSKVPTIKNKLNINTLEVSVLLYEFNIDYFRQS